MSDTAMTTTSAETGIDISRALTFFFEDPDWVPKLLVGTLFALLTPFGIGSVFVAGYALATARQARGGDHREAARGEALGGPPRGRAHAARRQGRGQALLPQGDALERRLGPCGEAFRAEAWRAGRVT